MTVVALPGKWGKFIGTVTSVTPKFIVQNSQGNKRQYAPVYVPMGNKEMLAAIAAVKVGDRVEAKWFRDGDRRLYSLKPAGTGPTAGGAIQASSE